MSLPPGTRLGRYEILTKLGEGWMGEVYLARDPKINRDVAIKVLPSNFSSDPERLRRFEQEALAAGAYERLTKTGELERLGRIVRQALRQSDGE